MRLEKLTRLFVWMLGLCGVLVLGGYLILTFLPTFGAGGNPDPSGNVLASKQFDGARFNNPIPTLPRADGEIVNNLKEMFNGDQVRVPPGPIPVQVIDPKSLNRLPGLRAYWLGHASVLVEVDGKRLLVDPIFSERASPFGFAGPKRFHPPPIALADLPAVDAVVISHDHYDHLDMRSVQHLAGKGSRFFVPPGIGAHLTRWGVSQDLINELDWGESEQLGELTITCTPAQHYSGRGLLDQGHTLWSSWTIIGPAHRVFYSGDTGFSPHFDEIGKQYGPFDLTIIKIGAYGPGVAWHGLHMPVDEAIKAHQAVRGKHMLPVHWGTFNMAYHAWDEPIELAVKAAQANQLDLLTPRVGEKITIGESFSASAWWRDVK